MIEAIATAMRLPAGGFSSALVAPLARDGQMRSIGPFVTVAHLLPATLAPGALDPDADVRPHPHIGIAALSYLFDGAMTHRDNLGHTQEIEPGAVNWMVAGSGIVHSERYTALRRDGGTLEGLQLWVALPDGHEDDAPGFAHHAVASIPAFAGDGIDGRLLAGAADGLRAPVAVPSPLFLQAVRLAAGASHRVPGGFEERAVYAISGALHCDGQRVDAGQAALFAAGAEVSVTAREPAHLLCLGGAPIGPRFMWWNFVASSPARIDAAKARWRAGSWPLPADDADDFTPAPEDRARPLFALNPR